jgi:DNA invertase Pin-like site-specific DNA recombinase
MSASPAARRVVILGVDTHRDAHVAGRPKLMNATQIAMAKAMLADRDTPVRKVHEALHVSRATLYRDLSADRAASGERPAPRSGSRTVLRRPQPTPTA